MNDDTLTCAVCGATTADWIGDHLAADHNMTVEAYRAAYPGAVIVSPRVQARAVPPASLRRQPPSLTAPLTVKLTPKGMEFPVNIGVPAEVCLPEPDNYKVPEYGDLSHDVAFALVGLQKGRSLFIWGPPGTGKDALFHYWSAKTRTPGIIKQVVPGTDIESWFFSRSFNEHGTSWDEGDVLRALRDGYLCEDGTRVPYIILFSDLDRAQKDQAEYMRLIIDSISGRVQGPAGKTYPVLPGTRIVATANTSGGGDSTGRMVSSNPLDGSLLNRWNYKLKFHLMDWKDEEPIVQAKFPLLVARVPTIFDSLGRATVAMRAAIADQTIYGEFSHRDVCHILMAATDLLMNTTSDKAKTNLLKKAIRVWLDGLPDEDTRKAAVNILDPHIKGGMVTAGNPSVSSDPLADL
jgi:MoxR-like ATPase